MSLEFPRTVNAVFHKVVVHFVRIVTNKGSCSEEIGRGAIDRYR